MRRDRMTRPLLVVGIGLVAGGCGLYDVLNEAVRSWQRHTIPGTHVSVVLPAVPVFTTYTFKNTPCGDIDRTSFSIRAKFGLYTGHFIRMTPACDHNGAHLIGLTRLVTSSAEAKWTSVGTKAIRGPAGEEATEESFRDASDPPKLLTVRGYHTSEGVLGLLAEREDNPLDQADATKFMDSLKTK
jgi:hypothetical protein